MATSKKSTKTETTPSEVLLQLKGVIQNAPELKPGFMLTPEDVESIVDVVRYVCTLYSANNDTTAPIIETLNSFNGLHADAVSLNSSLDVGAMN